MIRSNHNRPARWAAALLGALVLTAWASPRAALGQQDRMVLIDLGDRIRVSIGDELFAEYIYDGHSKPILYPVIGPHGVRMTRDYPMREGTINEAEDHPHHKSLWYAHGDVNGVDFWSEHGRIVHDGVLGYDSGGGRTAVTTRNKWIGPANRLICTDTTTIRFHTDGEDRIIDYGVTLHATGGDLVLGDTKEGTMAIRTHPGLRIDRGARAVNSEGVSGKPIWGQRAAWVDYSAEIDGRIIGVAIFDHPDNPRHPTTWHAREYGLIAANPFGLHQFQDVPAGTGDMTIPAGESVTFRYRFLFHSGDAKRARIAERYQRYAASAAASR